jgi:hypothetical protein
MTLPRPGLEQACNRDFCRGYLIARKFFDQRAERFRSFAGDFTTESHVEDESGVVFFVSEFNG